MDNKIDGWKIKLSNNFSGSLGGAKGVVIPQQFVKAIGDIFIINKATLPLRDEQLDLQTQTTEISLEGNDFSGL